MYNDAFKSEYLESIECKLQKHTIEHTNILDSIICCNVLSPTRIWTI